MPYPYEGYRGTDIYPPAEADQRKWYIIVHFDDPKHLAHWLESSDRQMIVEEGHKTFRKFKITYYKTGLERWFLKENASPPAWKQNLVILLGLDPTVMGLILLQSASPWMKSLQLADATLISNFLSCCLLGWIIMPFVTGLFKFWLLPTGQASAANTWVGTLLIIFGLVFLRSLFTLI